MIQIDVMQHVILYNHPVTRMLRDRLKSGALVVVDNKVAKTKVVAEVFGSCIREYHVLRRFPVITESDWEVLHRQFFRTAHDQREAEKSCGESLRKIRELKAEDGRRFREIRRKVGKTKRFGQVRRSLPIYNPPRLPGD